MKTLRIIGVVAVTGAILALAPMGSAVADETDTTFELTAAGGLVLATALTAELGDSTAGDTLITGNLGTVSVTDDRGTTAGWEISAGSTAFEDSAGGSDSTSVTYNVGTVTAGGSVTPDTALGAVEIQTGSAPVHGTEAVGNNAASYNPTLSVTLPPSALTGTYTGTVTTSVL